MYEYCSILKQACDGLFETQPIIKKEVIESIQNQETLNTSPETILDVDKNCDDFVQKLFDNKDDNALLDVSNDISNDSLDNSAIGN